MDRQVTRRLAAAAVAAALTATPWTPARAAGPPAAVPWQGCAHIADSGDGWADLYNSCPYWIHATVRVGGFIPGCVPVPPKGFRKLYWGHGRPDHVIECR